MVSIPSTMAPPWLDHRILLRVRAGSHAYGTNTPTSDLDVRGICVSPPSEYITFREPKTVFEIKENGADEVYYEVRKFFALAEAGNPNIVEILNTDWSDILTLGAHSLELIEDSKIFLSKKMQHTFGGYAKSQLDRMERHRRWLRSPPKAPPTRQELGLPEQPVIHKNQLAAAEAAVKKQMDSWELDLDGVEQARRVEIMTKLRDTLMQWQISDETKAHRAGFLLGFDTNFLEVLEKERAYKRAQDEWSHYLTWQKERNAARSELEAKYGFDCYTDDTEFLCEDGWKHFDDIKASDRLATVFVAEQDLTQRKALTVEYQHAIDRFQGSYTGDLYNLTGQHTDALVTPNHRMLISRVERVSKKTYPWALTEAAVLPDTFDVLVAPRPRTKAYSNQEHFATLPISDRAAMTLMGWYLSEGSINKRDGKARAIQLSQAADGRLAWHFARWQGDHGEKANSSLYKYDRTPNAFNPNPHKELVLSVRNKKLVAWIAKCGQVKTKRIPRWVFKLSRRLMETLLDAMMAGDGTTRAHETKQDSLVYYTSLKGLADDVQELALLCGWETALWGPYTYPDKPGLSMYQVHIRKGTELRRTFHKSNISKMDVIDQRIVCFTVPNGTLITRRNGKVAIHGNSKHAMHLVRLLRMAVEIMRDGKVIVKRPDAQELLAIRNGAWTYEQLMDWAATQKALLADVSATSSLPDRPDPEKVNELFRRVTKLWLE